MEITIWHILLVILLVLKLLSFPFPWWLVLAPIYFPIIIVGFVVVLEEGIWWSRNK